MQDCSKKEAGKRNQSTPPPGATTTTRGKGYFPLVSQKRETQGFLCGTGRLGKGVN